MKAKKMYLSVFLGVLLLPSCKTARDMVSENDICGEWNVVEIQGEPVRTQSNPFIGFDTKKGRVYGYSGCNRITGSLDLSRDNKIELGHMASTLMACPDMELEGKLIEVLSTVKNVKCAGKNKIALYASDKEPVMLLSKRFSVVPLSELEGEWNIVKVYGDTLSADLEVRPSVKLDIADGRISGNTGCNRITGELRSDETVGNSISFHSVAATRMMCPDMETEKNILSALNNVRTYGILENGNLVFFTAGGAVVLELKRNK